MRAKRSKQYRKLMHQYGLLFNFREPYQVLIDAAIVQAAARFKMRLGPLLESTLHGQIKPMITQCCIRHLYGLQVDEKDATGKKVKEECIAVAKQAERRRCGHHELDEPLSTLECLQSVLDPKGSRTNKHRYVVATQDQEVRQKMRQIAGVPLVYINRSVMILEPIAGRTEQVREREEKGKLRAGLKTRPGANVKRKREDSEEADEKANGEEADGDESQAEPVQKKQRKTKGPKGPNPLSVKKAKKDKPSTTKSTSNGDTVDATSNSAKRKRKRAREPQETGQTNQTRGVFQAQEDD